MPTLPASRFGRLREGWRRARAGKFGDFAVLKADALGSNARPAVASQLASVRGYRPPLDLAALAALPPGTFGRVYAAHMQTNKLTPFHVSDDLAPVADRNVFAARYAATHDMFHVLLGFDVSWAGEIGVLAFAAQQNYSRGLGVALALASVYYPLRHPSDIRRIFRAKSHGRATATAAGCLLAERIEDNWHRPLAEVRRAFELPENGAPADAGGLPDLYSAER